MFAVGAILYELLTSAVVGPGMRRPSELVPGLPGAVETILGKALVADPKHRPADLGALAQALHHDAPGASIAPPPADEGRLDTGLDYEVDVRLLDDPAQRGAGDPQGRARCRSSQGDGPYAIIVKPRRTAPRSAAPPTRPGASPT